MIYLIYQSSKFNKQITYTFELIFSHYGISYQVIQYDDFSSIMLDPSSVVISYGNEKAVGPFLYHIHIFESGFFGPDYLKPESMPETPLKQFRALPIIYSGNGNLSDWVVVHKNDLGGRTVETNIDFIASCFFMLTRYEEVLLNELDKFDRFPATASLAYKEGVLDRPIVNEYIELLLSWIERFNLGFKRKCLWDGKDFAVCLTYDVDAVRKHNWYPPFRTIASSTLKHGNPKKSLALAKDYLKAKFKSDPYDKFTYLINLSKRYGFQSSFYFMSGGKTARDSCYKINTKHVVSIMRNIQENGFEIGLHISFDAYQNSLMISSEKAKLENVLGNPVFGARQHYLRWKTPDSWRAREAAGLKYDTSLSFADHEGFRSGICTPYKPFDVLENRVLDVWELPLTVMDGSLYHYQRLSPDEAFHRVNLLVDKVKKYQGVFVLLWHNSSFDELSWPGWSHTFERILEYLHKQNVFSDTAQGIIKRWEDEIYK
jgi:hypothetical protein